MLANTLSRIRRNHGLEHATIHVLSEKHSNFSAQGNSDHRGFFLNIYGSLSEDAVFDAVEEAYTRLKNGEHQLAVHPNCGTVLLTTATMATLAAQAVIGLEQKRQRTDRLSPASMLGVLPSAILSVVMMLIISRPLGIQLQARYTVEGDPKELQLLRMQKISPSPVTRFFQFLLTGGRGSIPATAYRIETIG